MHDDIDLRTRPTRFAFEFDRRFLPLSAVFGVLPRTAWLDLDHDLEIRFGLWHLVTSRENVARVAITGPYRLLKVAGPARLSVRDRGITLATNARQGVCIGFHEPVRAIDPVGAIRHPAVTVTVHDVAGLVLALGGPSSDVEVPGTEPDDGLMALTASQLREEARRLGLAGVGKLKKDELLDVLRAAADQSRVSALASEFHDQPHP